MGIRTRTATGFTFILALLALVPRVAAAQSSPFDRPDAPALVSGFGSGGVQLLEQEFRSDLYALGVFAGKRRLDQFDSAGLERPSPWTVYGRLGPINFQNQMQYGSNAQFSFRKQGPTIGGGRVYFGLYKTFD